ncbi:ABC transporter ATP-binding protein [Leptospira interrogans]
MRYKLAVEKLSKSYAKAVALAPTDLHVAEGQFVTLLGPSGSGKTTLLMMIAGLLEPDSGEIWIDGRRATYAPPYARDIGMVFQNYALFPHLSIYENIAFPLRMRKASETEIDSEVRRVLEIVQLPHVADRLPSALSGGQQQRIALARCVVFKPSLILMDEPLGALDKKLRDQLQIEIKHLHKQLGTTILYVTHDQQEALTMSDRVCLMNHGRIEQFGAPEEIYFHPRTIFAADFLGESNIFAANVETTAGGLASVRSPRLGHHKIMAPADDRFNKGPCSLLVRPESIVVGSKVDGMNTITGALEETIFTGNVTKFFVKTPGGETVFCETLTSKNGSLPQPGTTISISWPVQATVLLPGAGS